MKISQVMETLKKFRYPLSFAVLLVVLYLGFGTDKFSRNELTPKEKIWYTYLYYQKVASREAGCVDENDIECQDRFNSVWSSYSAKLKAELNITSTELDAAISAGIEHAAANRDFSYLHVTEQQLADILKNN
jgi:hypothetical protein